MFKLFFICSFRQSCQIAQLNWMFELFDTFASVRYVHIFILDHGKVNND